MHKTIGDLERYRKFINQSNDEKWTYPSENLRDEVKTKISKEKMEISALLEELKNKQI